jgi:beta-glucosidase
VTPAPEGFAPTPEHQAAALLAELTVAEKLAFLHQHQPAVDRLGLAKFHTGCEALHGVAWIGEATVFPQAVGLGATWDTDLVRRVGEAVSTEVRAFNQDTANALQLSGQSEKPPMVSLNVWAPVVNPLRDPRWGRNEEGYSEDPYATASIATAYCTGLRGDHPTVWRTTPVLKHFLAYNTETDRDIVDIHVPERSLHEYELEAFRGPIQAGVVAGVMPGYNLTNGIPNHVHPLINQALHAWDPNLAICSDAQAPSNLVEREKFFPTHAESHAAALKAGVDSYTDNNTDSQTTIDRFTEALERGLITEADIDTAVRRLLLLRARTGEFAPETDPYRAIRANVINCAQHRDLAKEAALASIVLLKNENSALPLTPHVTAPTRLAVIGHLGTRVLTDWYSGTLPYRISIAEGLRTEFTNEETEILAADGADLVVLRTTDGTVDFGPFRHQNWGTSVQCPRPVHTLQSVENGKYLTLTGPADTEIEPRSDAPDGWFVKELWEFETIDGTAAAEALPGEPLLLRSNAPHNRKYARIDYTTGRLLVRRRNPRTGHPLLPRANLLRHPRGHRARDLGRPRRTGPRQRPPHQRPRNDRPRRPRTAAATRAPAARSSRGEPERRTRDRLQLPLRDRLGRRTRPGHPLDLARRPRTRHRRRTRAHRPPQPLGPPAPDLVLRRRRTPRARRLRHHRIRLDLPLFAAGARLSVRPWSFLRDFRVPQPGSDGAGGDAGSAHSSR